MLKHVRDPAISPSKQLEQNELRGLFDAHIDALLNNNNARNATNALCTLLPDHQELLPYLLNKVIPTFLTDQNCNVEIFDALIRIGKRLGVKFDSSYVSPEDDLHGARIGRMDAVGMMIEYLPSGSSGDLVRFGAVGALVNLLDGEPKECADFHGELKKSSPYLSRTASGSFDSLTDELRTESVLLLCAIAELDPDLGSETCRNLERRFHFLTSLVKPTDDYRDNTTRENKKSRAILKLLGVQNAVDALSSLNKDLALTLREIFLKAALRSNIVSAELIGGMLRSIADARSGQESEIVSHLRLAVETDLSTLEQNGPLDPQFSIRRKNLAGNIRVFCDFVSREFTLAEKYIPEIFEKFERSIRDIPDRDLNLAFAGGLVDIAATRPENAECIMRLGIPTHLVNGLRNEGWVGDNTEKRGATVRCLTGLVKAVRDAPSAHDILMQLVVHLKEFPLTEQKELPSFIANALGGFRENITTFYQNCFSVLNPATDAEVATVLVDMATTMLKSRTLNLDDASDIHQCATSWIRGPLNLGMTKGELNKTEMGKSLNKLNSEIMKREKLRHKAIGKLAGDSIPTINELP